MKDEYEEVEIEFAEWVHPRWGVMPVNVEGGKPLVLKAKIRRKTDDSEDSVSAKRTVASKGREGKR
jgi:hypothetical protein